MGGLEPGQTFEEIASCSTASSEDASFMTVWLDPLAYPSQEDPFGKDWQLCGEYDNSSVRTPLLEKGQMDCVELPSKASSVATSRGRPVQRSPQSQRHVVDWVAEPAKIHLDPLRTSARDHSERATQKEVNRDNPLKIELDDEPDMCHEILGIRGASSPKAGHTASTKPDLSTKIPVLKPDKKFSCKGPGTKSLGDQASERKRDRWTCKFVFFGFDPDRDGDFDLVPRLIGRGGLHVKAISSACQGKVRIRGIGSGHKEAQKGGKSPAEANVTLQIVLSCSTRSLLEDGKRQANILLQDLSCHFDKFRHTRGLDRVPLYSVVEDPREGCDSR